MLQRNYLKHLFEFYGQVPFGYAHYAVRIGLFIHTKNIHTVQHYHFAVLLNNVLNFKHLIRPVPRRFQRNNIIQDDITLEEEFNSFCKKNERQYRSYLEPNKNKYLLAAKNRGWIKRNISGNKALLYLNIIRAEAHRDILINLLSNENSIS